MVMPIHSPTGISSCLLTWLEIIFVYTPKFNRPSCANTHTVAHEQTGQLFSINQDNPLMARPASEALRLIGEVAGGYEDSLRGAMTNEGTNKRRNIFYSDNDI